MYAGFQVECCTDGVNWRLARPVDLSNPSLTVRRLMPDGTRSEPMLLTQLQRWMAEQAK